MFAYIVSSPIMGYYFLVEFEYDCKQEIQK